MNKIILLLVMNVCLTAAMVFDTHAEEADRVEKARRQPSAFVLSVKLNNPKDDKAVLKSTMTVDGVAEFLIESPKTLADNGNAVYDLYFFRDGLAEDIVKSISLPYVFKQNFAGLNNGNYQLQFMLINQAGQVGRIDQPVVVSHNP